MGCPSTPLDHQLFNQLLCLAILALLVLLTETTFSKVASAFSTTFSKAAASLSSATFSKVAGLFLGALDFLELFDLDLELEAEQL